MKQNLSVLKRGILVAIFFSLLVTFSIYQMSISNLIGLRRLGVTFERQGQMSRTPNSSSTTASPATTSTEENASTVVNPHDYRYVINPSDLCPEGDEIELLICVPISRDNFEGRRVISETWGSYATFEENKSMLLFFIGNGSASESVTIQNKINSEADNYKDIVQEDYIDSYKNLSLKSVSILRWVKTYCPQAKYVVKADDDIYINIPNLMTHLRKTSQKHENFVSGFIIRKAVPVRNNRSKWYSPDFQEKVYPDYTSGTSYSMSGSAAKLLYASSLVTPLFWLEDVYITGLCRRKSGVTLVNQPGSTYNKPKAEGCVFRKMIHGHRYSLSEMRMIHSQVTNPHYKCH